MSTPCEHGLHPGFDCAICQVGIDEEFAQLERDAALGRAVRGSLDYGADAPAYLEHVAHRWGGEVIMARRVLLAIAAALREEGK